MSEPAKKPAAATDGINRKSKEMQARTMRSRIFYSVLVFFTVAVVFYLLYYLEPLILPVILGILAAYICQPLLDKLYRRGLPRWASVLVLLGGFIFLIFLLVRYVVALVPDEMEQRQLTVSVQQNINDRYVQYMDIGEGRSGNLLYDIAGPELDPLMDSFNQWIYLSENGLATLEEWADEQGEPVSGNVKSQIDRIRSLTLYTEPDVLVSDRLAELQLDGLQVRDEADDESSLLISALNILSIWLVMPVMFFFFLIDNGQIKKKLIALVPNTYFEMSLTVLNNVDKVIGNYLRGTLLETLLMATTLWVLLSLIGFDAGIAVVLAIVSAIANIIPIFGMFIGIAICVLYALILENISTIIPFITVENLVIWTVLVHLFAQAIDNAVYKPFVLGKAISLHPIAVFLGAIAGSIIYGFVGLLFAIPAIIILREIITTLHSQLKAYFLIY